MTNSINEKHMQTENKGYIDHNQIDQNQSYYIKARPSVYGGCLVYQRIVMLDGTIYNLKTQTASTRGILAHKCLDKNLLQREVKSNFNETTIHY